MYLFIYLFIYLFQYISIASCQIQSQIRPSSPDLSPELHKNNIIAYECYILNSDIKFFFSISSPFFFQHHAQRAGFKVSTVPATSSRPPPWDGTGPNPPVKHRDQSLQF